MAELAPTRAAPLVTNTQVAPTGSFYAGFSVRETTGTTTARVDIYDGSDATGTLLDTIPLTAGQGASDYYDEGLVGPTGAPRGAFVVITGSVAGSVRYRQ